MGCMPCLDGPSTSTVTVVASMCMACSAAMAMCPIEICSSIFIGQGCLLHADAAASLMSSGLTSVGYCLFSCQPLGWWRQECSSVRCSLLHGTCARIQMSLPHCQMSLTLNSVCVAHTACPVATTIITQKSGSSHTHSNPFRLTLLLLVGNTTLCTPLFWARHWALTQNTQITMSANIAVQCGPADSLQAVLTVHTHDSSLCPTAGHQQITTNKQLLWPCC